MESYKQQPTEVGYPASKPLGFSPQEYQQPSESKGMATDFGTQAGQSYDHGNPTVNINRPNAATNGAVDGQKRLNALYKQNTRLKEQLREINAKITDVLDSITDKTPQPKLFSGQMGAPATRTSPKKANGPQSTRAQAQPTAADRSPDQVSANQLEITQKKHRRYATEFAKVKARYDKVLDPSVRSDLIQGISDLEEQVREAKLQISEEKSTLQHNSKNLGGVAENGVTSEMNYASSQLLNEIAFFGKKNTDLEKRLRTNARSLQQMGDIENSAVTTHAQKRTAAEGLAPTKPSEAEQSLHMRKEAMIKDHQTVASATVSSVNRLKAQIGALRAELGNRQNQLNVKEQLFQEVQSRLSVREQRLQEARANPDYQTASRMWQSGEDPLAHSRNSSMPTLRQTNGARPVKPQLIL